MVTPSSDVLSSTFAPSLLRLPAVLLPHVCGFLSPNDLLVTLARAAKQTRDSLTAACFSPNVLTLSPGALSRLSSLVSASALGLRLFLARVLSCCQLEVEWDSETGMSMQRLLASLDHFHACRVLRLHGTTDWPRLGDRDLHRLLHHPTTLTCTELEIDEGFHHEQHEAIPVDEKEAEGMSDVRVTRSMKRKHDSAVVPWTKVFDWATISLPSVTRLRLLITGRVPYIGGAAFLTAHTALLELHVTFLLVSQYELTAVFRDTAALPQLTALGLHDERWHEFCGRDCSDLLTAVATTVVAQSGRPRPLAWLRLDLHALPRRELFAAVVPMSALTSLHLDSAQSGWLDEWTGTPDIATAFPQLQQVTISTRGYAEDMSSDFFQFLQSVAHCPLQLLHIKAGHRITTDTAALSQLARFHQLRSLYISRGFSARSDCLDWRDQALFASFTLGCLPHLTSVRLQQVKMSAASVAAIASATPHARAPSQPGRAELPSRSCVCYRRRLLPAYRRAVCRWSAETRVGRGAGSRRRRYVSVVRGRCRTKQQLSAVHSTTHAAHTDVQSHTRVRVACGAVTAEACVMPAVRVRVSQRRPSHRLRFVVPAISLVRALRLLLAAVVHHLHEAAISTDRSAPLLCCFHAAKQEQRQSMARNTRADGHCGRRALRSALRAAVAPQSPRGIPAVSQR